MAAHDVGRHFSAVSPVHNVYGQHWHRIVYGRRNALAAAAEGAQAGGGDGDGSAVPQAVRQVVESTLAAALQALPLGQQWRGAVTEKQS
eukprot:COSAG01_NODE_6895_length_3448_cov_3.556285_6_plen_89_part_00